MNHAYKNFAESMHPKLELPKGGLGSATKDEHRYRRKHHVKTAVQIAVRINNPILEHLTLL